MCRWRCDIVQCLNSIQGEEGSCAQLLDVHEQDQWVSGQCDRLKVSYFRTLSTPIIYICKALIQEDRNHFEMVCRKRPCCAV